MADLGLRIRLQNKVGTKDEYDKFVKQLSAQKIDLKINFDSAQMSNVTKSIKMISDLIGTIDFSKVKGATVLNDEMVKTGNSVKEVANVMNELQSKQFKIVNGEDVQTIEKIKKSLLETQKIVRNYKDGEPTSTSSVTSLNFAKAQKELYGQLNKLQKEEFTLKGSIIGQDGLIKAELEKQLGLVKSQQTEVAKLVNSYGVKGEDGITKNLKERETLTSNLIIKQEQYNQSMNTKASGERERVLKEEQKIRKTMADAEASETSKNAVARERVLKEEQKIRQAILKSENSTQSDKQNAVYKEMEVSVKKIYDLKRQLKSADDQENEALKKHLTTQLQIEQSNLKTLSNVKKTGNLGDLEKELALNKQITQEVVKINSAKLKQDKTSTDTQQNKYYTEANTLLTQIHAKKVLILNTDKNDIDTQKRLNDQLTVLNTNQASNKAKITSKEQLLALGAKEVANEEKLINLKSQKTFQVDTGEATRIAKLGDQLKNLKTQVPADLFGKTNAEITEFVQKIYGAESKISNFAKSASTLENANVKMTVSTKNGKNELIQESLVLDRNTNAIYKSSTATVQLVSMKDKFIARLKNAGVALASFVGITTIFYQALHEIQGGVATVIALDTALNTVNMTMDMTKSEMSELTTTSQSMAKEMGISIDEVLNAVKVYANANETVANILEKTKADIMLSTASGMSTTDTTDSIQGIMNQFELEAEGSAERIADTLEKVSANMAYDFGKGIKEITEGIKVSGAVAKDAGFELEEYEALLGKIIEKTRLSGSTVGNAERTIFARLGKAKSGDASAEEISNAEGAYKSVGISLRDQAGEFRDIPEVLDELSKKWKNLNSVQQAYVTDASAGVRQGNIFKTMMKSWGESTDLATKALDSNGFAMERQQIYLQSTKAKIQEFKTTTEVAWQTMLSSEFINVFVTGATKLAETFFSLEKMVGVATVSLLLFKGTAIVNGLLAVNSYIAGMVLMTAQVGITAIAQDGLTIATKALTTAFLANPVTAIVAGLLLIVGAFKLVEMQGKKAQKAFADVLETNKASVAQNKITSEFLTNEGDAYDTLSQKMNLNTEEQTRLKGMKEQIANLFPELVTGYNNETGEIEIQAKSTADLIELMKEKNKLANDAILVAGDTGLESAQSKIKETRKDVKADKFEETRIQTGASKEIWGQRYHDTNNINDVTEKIADLQKLQAQDEGNLKIGAKIAVQKAKLKKLEEELSLAKKQTSTDSQIEIANAKESNTLVSAIINDYGDLTDAQKAVASTKIKFSADELMQFETGDFASLTVKVKEELASIAENKTVMKISDLIQIKPDDVDDKTVSDYFDNIFKASKEMGIDPIELTKLLPLQADPTAITKALEAYYDSITALMMAEKDPTKRKELLVQAEAIENYVLSIKVDGVDEATTGMNKLSASVEGYADSQKKMMDAFESSESAVKDMNQAIDSLNQGETLSADEVSELTKKYPELASAVTGSAGSYNIEEKALNAVREAHIETANTTLTTQLDSSKAVLTGVKDRLHSYGVEIEAIGSLADAQRLSANLTTKPLAEGMLGPENPFIEENKEIVKSMEQYGMLQDQIAKLGKTLGDPTLGVSKTTEKATEGMSALEKGIALATKATQAYERAMEALNYQMKKQDNQLAKLNEGSKEYREGLRAKAKLIEKEIALTKQSIATNEASAKSVASLEIADSKLSKNSTSSSSSSNSSSANNSAGSSYSGGGTYKGGYANGKYADWINQAGAQYGIDPNIIAGMIQTESTFDAGAYNKKSGATGLGQFLKSTADDEGLKDRTDAQSSIFALAKYLKKRIGWAGGSVKEGIKGYGEGTEAYYNKVMGNTPSSGGQGSYSTTSSSNTSSGSLTIAQIQKIVGTTADGIMGSQTKSAIKAWQKANGLDADGIVGAKTLAKMGGGSASSTTSSTGVEVSTSASDGLLSTIESQKQSLLDLQAELEEIPYLVFKDVLTEFDNRASVYEKHISVIKNEIETSSNGVVKATYHREILDDLNQEMVIVRDKEAYLKREIASRRYTAGQVAEMNSLLADTVETESSLVVAIKAEYEERIAIIQSAESKVTEVIQKQVEQRKEAVEKAYEDEQKALEEKYESDKKAIEDRYDTEKEAIADTYEATKKSIEDTKELYNSENTTDDYNKNLRKEQTTMSDLDAEITSASRDTSSSGQARLKILQDEKLAQQDVIDAMVLQRSRDLNNESFDAELTKLDEQNTKNNETLDTNNENETTGLDEQNELNNEKIDAKKDTDLEYLDKTYGVAQLAQMAKDAVISGYLLDINGKVITVTSAVQDFENKFGAGLSTMGASIKTNLIANLTEANELIRIMNSQGTLNSVSSTNLLDGSHKDGLDSVPYDGYIAELHKKETVLTAEEAPIWRRMKVMNIFSNPNKFKTGIAERNLPTFKSPEMNTVNMNSVGTNTAPVVTFEQPLMVIQNATKDSIPDLEKFMNQATDKALSRIMEAIGEPQH